MLRCKNSPTNLKRKKKGSQNYTHILDFAYIISKTCINEETQAFKELSICDLLEVSAKKPLAEVSAHTKKPLADHLLNTALL